MNDPPFVPAIYQQHDRTCGSGDTEGVTTVTDNMTEADIHVEQYHEQPYDEWKAAERNRRHQEYLAWRKQIDSLTVGELLALFEAADWDRGEKVLREILGCVDDVYDYFDDDLRRFAVGLAGYVVGAKGVVGHEEDDVMALPDNYRASANQIVRLLGHIASCTLNTLQDDELSPAARARLELIVKAGQEATDDIWDERQAWRKAAEEKAEVVS